MNGATVTRLHQTKSGRDAYGNDLYAATETDLTGVILWPRGGDSGRSSSAENTTGGDTVTDGLTMLLPPATIVAPTDKFRIDGVIYDVDGSAGDWTSGLTGWAPGRQVALRRVTG